ncbi:hypothetical protein HYDPIDRAFT_24047 [Hydnomerulius pinastri MD-312]|nr:hypothetical protein HYDPIDRAFT_24047 [Hydnomerulius pinastri MD-312]
MSLFNKFERRAQDAETTSTTSSFLPVNPSYIPAGPEAAPPTLSSQSSPPTLTPQSKSSNGGLSTASTASIAVFLSLFGLLALTYTIWQIRRWRRKPKALSLNDRHSEKGGVRDIEAEGSARPTIPVPPPPGVGWTPQIRSISCPMPAEGPEKKSTVSTPKRARSPPPSYVTKPQNPFADPYPKSAPPHTMSFSDNGLRTPVTASRRESPSPVTPHALSVSGMQTRSLGVKKL